MPTTELGRLLKELESEIGEGGPLDDAVREALSQLQGRIAAVLATSGEPAETDARSLSEPIADYVDRFEASHPTLTMTLGRIMDALNKLGI